MPSGVLDSCLFVLATGDAWCVIKSFAGLVVGFALSRFSRWPKCRQIAKTSRESVKPTSARKIRASLWDVFYATWTKPSRICGSTVPGTESLRVNFSGNAGKWYKGRSISQFSYMTEHVITLHVSACTARDSDLGPTHELCARTKNEWYWNRDRHIGFEAINPAVYLNLAVVDNAKRRDAYIAIKRCPLTHTHSFHGWTCISVCLERCHLFQNSPPHSPWS